MSDNINHGWIIIQNRGNSPDPDAYDFLDDDQLDDEEFNEAIGLFDTYDEAEAAASEYRDESHSVFICCLRRHPRAAQSR